MQSLKILKKSPFESIEILKKKINCKLTENK